MPIGDQLAVALAADRRRKAHQPGGIAAALSTAPKGVRYLNRAYLDNPDDLRTWQAAKRIYRAEREHFGADPVQLALPSGMSAKKAAGGVVGFYDPDVSKGVVFLDDDTRKALAAAGIGQRPEASRSMMDTVELNGPKGLYNRMHPLKTVEVPMYPHGRDKQGRRVPKDLQGMTTSKTVEGAPPDDLARMVAGRARDWQLREGVGTLVHELAHTNQRAVRAEQQPGYRPPADVRASDARVEGGADAFDRLFSPQIAREAGLGRLAETPDLSDYDRIRQQVLQALGRRWVSRGQFGAPR